MELNESLLVPIFQQNIHLLYVLDIKGTQNLQTNVGSWED